MYMYMYKLFDFVLTFISKTKIYVVNLELYPFNFVVTFILETKKKNLLIWNSAIWFCFNFYLKKQK